MKYLFLLLIFFFSFQQTTRSENILNEFLVAKPHMPDPRFKESVILMLYHSNEEGAAGLVINKPIETMYISEFFKSINLVPPEKIAKKEITLYWGGPVEPKKIFFIYSSDYKSNDFISSNKNFTVSLSLDILFDIANNKGPKKYLILSGIAVWRPGQLDSEMMQGDWDKKSNNYIPLFNHNNEMWNLLTSSQEI